MGLKDIDLGAALSRLADRKIDQAMREGKFDNLEGAGQPLELEAAPIEENARLRWWALRILRKNDVIPDEVRWRKRLDAIRSRLDVEADERQVVRLVDEFNSIVRRLNTMGTNAINLPVAMLHAPDELARLKGRWAASRIALDTISDALTEPQPAPGPQPAPRVQAGQEARHGVPSVLGLAVKTCRRATCRSRNPGRAMYCRCCGQKL